MVREVAVGVSDHIVAPLLIGVFKPMILLPASALTGWSAEQLEMVLLHELAHVRRWDNLVNMSQRIVESILFFHPVVWIVSNWVRTEREYCCDQVVLANTGKPREYVSTLVSLAQVQRSKVAAVAMADGGLVSRVRHILQMEQSAPRYTRRAVCTLAALVVIALIGLGGVAQYVRYADRSGADTEEVGPLVLEFEGFWPEGREFELAKGEDDIPDSFYAFGTDNPKLTALVNTEIESDVLALNELVLSVSEGHPSIEAYLEFEPLKETEPVLLTAQLYNRNGELLGVQRLLELNTTGVAPSVSKSKADFRSVDPANVYSYEITVRKLDVPTLADFLRADEIGLRKGAAKALENLELGMLSSEVSVELIGISYSPSNDFSWWSPDGTPLDEPPVSSELAGSFANGIDDGLELVFKLEGDGLSGERALVDVTGAPDMAEIEIIPVGDKGVYKVHIPRVSVDKESGDVRFAVNNDVWITRASAPVNGGSFKSYGVTGTYSFDFQAPQDFDYGTSIIVNHNVRYRQLRILAVDIHGNVRRTVSSSTNDSDEQQTTEARFAGVSPEELVQFRAQVKQPAGWEWVDFRNVAMEQGIITEPFLSIRPPFTDAALMTPDKSKPSLERYRAGSPALKPIPRPAPGEIVLDDEHPNVVL